MDETPEDLPAAVLFDLDGTLVDSLPDLMLALNKVLVELGRRPAGPAEVAGWVGDGVRMLVIRGLEATGGVPEGDPAILVERFLQVYSGHTAVETRLYPGVERALEALRAERHPLGVCTNKPVGLSLELLDGLGVTRMFDAVIGGDSLPVRKPDPEHLRGTLAAMGAAGRRAVMVGDGRNDVTAAHAAGIPVVLFSRGYSGGDPRALGADAVIDDFAELVPAIRDLLRHSGDRKGGDGA